MMDEVRYSKLKDHADDDDDDEVSISFGNHNADVDEVSNADGTPKDEGNRILSDLSHLLGLEDGNEKNHETCEEIYVNLSHFLDKGGPLTTYLLENQEYFKTHKEDYDAFFLELKRKMQLFVRTCPGNNSGMEFHLLNRIDHMQIFLGPKIWSRALQSIYGNLRGITGKDLVEGTEYMRRQKDFRRTHGHVILNELTTLLGLFDRVKKDDATCKNILEKLLNFLDKKGPLTTYLLEKQEYFRSHKEEYYNFFSKLKNIIQLFVGPCFGKNSRIEQKLLTYIGHLQITLGPKIWSRAYQSIMGNILRKTGDGLVQGTEYLRSEEEIHLTHNETAINDELKEIRKIPDSSEKFEKLKHFLSRDGNFVNRLSTTDDYKWDKQKFTKFFNYVRRVVEEIMNECKSIPKHNKNNVRTHMNHLQLVLRPHIMSRAYQSMMSKVFGKSRKELVHDLKGGRRKRKTKRQRRHKTKRRRFR